jgi:O-antigen biosynthesis protein
MISETKLKKANAALRTLNYAEAIDLYLEILVEEPVLSNLIEGNLKIIANRSSAGENKEKAKNVLDNGMKNLQKKGLKEISQSLLLFYKSNELFHYKAPQIVKYTNSIKVSRIDSFVSWQLMNKRSKRWASVINTIVKNHEKNGPLFSVIIPVYDPDLGVFNEAVESVLKQSYSKFELILVDDCSKDNEIRKRINYFASKDKRVIPKFRKENGHISAATNSGAKIANGSFLVLVDNDDKLDKNALALFAKYIIDNPDTDILYSDDAKIDSKNGRLKSPKFKPDWSPELLLSYCYISHLKAIRTSLYKKIGGSRLGFEGSQDHDMLLRGSELARHIGHIPQILYHRRVLPGSTASSGHAKPYSFEAGRKAVEETFHRRGLKCDVIHPEWAYKAGVGIYVPNMPDVGPTVTIIIPTKNNYKVLKRLINSLKKTAYKNYTILIVDNESDDPETLDYLNNSGIKVKKIKNEGSSFSYAMINNKAALEVNSEYILFLNDDTEVIEPTWLSQMVGWSLLNGVGAVGARLLYPNERVQHGGVVMGLKNGLTAFRGLDKRKSGYLWYAKVTRNTTAVTAAAMLTHRKLFLELGGFDEEKFAVAYNDVDYCMRLRSKGYRVVYCGEAELYHHEGYTRKRGDNPSEIAALKKKYGDYIDPLFNPNLSLQSNKYEIKPTVIPPGEIKEKIRVLAVTHNLNHEGAPNSALELIAGLSNRGLISVEVISPQDGPLRAEYEKIGIKVRIIDKPRPTQDINLLADYEKRIGKVNAEVNFNEFDLVYANTAKSFWAIDLANKKKIPSVWNIRESEPLLYHFEEFPLEVQKIALNSFAYPYRVVFVAESTMKIWNTVNVSDNFDTIHNGINPKIFKKNISNGIDRKKARETLSIKHDEICLLSVGTTSSRKSQHDLIMALELLSDETIKRIKLFIVGKRENRYTEELIKMINLLPSSIKKRIELVKETRNTGLYWSSADIFIMTSILESYPRVILEAMSNNLTIITTPVFGVVEQVRENINALYYDAGNYEQLSEKITKLVWNNELRRRLSLNSEDVLNCLESYNGMLSKYYKIFYEASFSSTLPRSNYISIYKRRSKVSE